MQNIEVPRVAVDLEEIRRYSSEDQFMSLMAQLAQETGSLLAVAACLTRGTSADELQPWPRDKAILCGLMVRLAKLVTAFLGTACGGKLELSRIYVRLIFETCVNLRFLIVEDSAQTYGSFVQYSLRSERRLLSLIHDNIAARGSRMPIEERMISSIERSLASSSTNTDQMQEDCARWKKTSLETKARKVGLEDHYLAFFMLQSHAVHGNWEDLFRYHLREQGGGFLPDASWHLPTPQVFGAPMIVCLQTARIYLRHMFGVESERLEAELAELEERFMAVERLHEAFLENEAANNLTGD